MQRFALWLLLSVFGSAITILAAQGLPATAVSDLTVTSQTATQLRDWDNRANAMLRTGELAVRTLRVDTVLADRVHERLDQYVSGVRVYGGELVRQMRHGITESLFGTVYNDINVSTTPALSEDAARGRFAALSGAPLPADRAIELVILPRDEGGYALAWRTHVWTADGWTHTFLDASTGSVLLQYRDQQAQAAGGTGTGVLGDTKKISTHFFSGKYLASDQLRPPQLLTFDMDGNVQRALRVLYFGLNPTINDLASDTDNTWTDGAAVDAHVYVGWTYDYLFRRMGRKGLDDRNIAIRGITHAARRADIFFASPSTINDFYLGAFWCPGCGPAGEGMMVFGEGLPEGYAIAGQYWDYFSAGLDVVAHELTHGLTNYSSDLEYRNESGALNEGFSDIIGTSVEFFFQPPGSGPRQADYLCGEDVIRPGGLRSMENPLAFGDPDHYSARYRGSADSGGVHTNSGIVNQAFYLAIEGGTNRTSGMRVTGVGAANREQIERVFYHAFVYKLTRRSSFHSARVATIQSGRELYGNESATVRAITDAWTAVGVN